MYEELVTRLRRYSTYNSLSLGKREDMTAAADAIEELSMRLHGDEAAIAGMKREIERMVRSQKPRWIPVTERLPETWEKVLTYGLSEIAIDCQALGGGWVFGNHVTHWMPLPEPPEEGKE